MRKAYKWLNKGTNIVWQVHVKNMPEMLNFSYDTGLSMKRNDVFFPSSHILKCGQEFYKSRGTRKTDPHTLLICEKGLTRKHNCVISQNFKTKSYV